MRRIFRSLVGMAMTGIAMAMVRRWSRSRGMQRKVDRLQHRFQGQDRVGSMPTNP